jgi:copper chaperone CopZ
LFIKIRIMKNMTINTILIILVSATLGTLAFFVRLGATADRVVVLQAEGMTWGGSVASIEKALQSKRGVASVEVDVDNGGVAVAYDAKVIKPEILAQTVTALGYESSVAQNFSAEEYRAVTGRDVASHSTAKSGGCGCCNKNRN